MGSKLIWGIVMVVIVILLGMWIFGGGDDGNSGADDLNDGGGESDGDLGVAEEVVADSIVDDSDDLDLGELF